MRTPAWVLLLLGLVPSVWSDGATWRQLVRRGLTCYCAPGDRVYGERLLNWTEAWLADRRSEGGGAWPDTVTLVVAPDQGEFVRLTGGRVPEWGAAAAIPAERVIVVHAPDPRYTEDEARRILAHELGHLTLHLWAGGHPLPRWFDEGAVQLWSSVWRLETTVRLARAWRGGDLPVLDDLDGLLELPESRAQVAYAAAFDAVRTLVAEHGPGVIGRIAQSLSQGVSFDKAFAAAVGESEADFESAWRAALAQRYRWAAFMEWPLLFSVLLILFFFLALAARQAQRRRQLALWRDEEGDREFE